MKIPEYLTFSVWATQQPCHEPTQYRPSTSRSAALFNTPFFASEEAIKTYSTETLLNLRDFLRARAKDFGGLNCQQNLFDLKNRDSLWITEESQEWLASIPTGKNPIRTIAIMATEIKNYGKRPKSEWLNVRLLERS